jgi:hypothetical protein
MGRIVKNTVFKSGSSALGVPTGNTAVRPSNPVVGQTRWNTDRGRLEFYANISITGTAGWFPIAQSGNVHVASEYFSGNNTSTNFFSTVVNSAWVGREAAALVHVGQVWQEPNKYTFYANGMINFNSAPGVGTNNIAFIYGYATTQANIA